MAIKGWASRSRWWIHKWQKEWVVFPSRECGNASIPIYRGTSYSEAIAAYLDAVTCENTTPFLEYTEERCYRTRGHDGGHKFKGKFGKTDLEQMPK